MPWLHTGHLLSPAPVCGRLLDLPGHTRALCQPRLLRPATTPNLACAQRSSHAEQVPTLQQACPYQRRASSLLLELLAQMWGTHCLQTAACLMRREPVSWPGMEMRTGAGLMQRAGFGSVGQTWRYQGVSGTERWLLVCLEAQAARVIFETLQACGQEDRAHVWIRTGCGFKSLFASFPPMEAWAISQQGSRIWP